HLDSLHGPRSVVVLEVVGAIAHPHADISFWILADHKRVYVAAVHILFGSPLDRGEAADCRVHARKFVGHEPCGAKGADSARGFSGDCAAITVLPELVSLL